MTRILATPLLLLFMLTPGSAHAASQMRCGSQLIKIGDTKSAVEAKCGQPDYREVVSGANDMKQEVWVYRMGSTQFARTLTFVGFYLDNIEVETYR